MAAVLLVRHRHGNPGWVGSQRRTIKYGHVYLYAYDSMKEAKEHLKVYLTFYNAERPHR
ncbi:MAG: transposase [Acidobacteria bacterium]|nr:transposase [Acidobacteriota bacterium]